MTAASSLVEASTRIRVSVGSGTWRKTCASSSGPSLQAQPAPCDSDVNRMRGFWSRGASVIAFLRTRAMNDFWGAYATAFILGAVHALEVDHMVAVSAFVGGD